MAITQTRRPTDIRHRPPCGKETAVRPPTCDHRLPRGMRRLNQLCLGCAAHQTGNIRPEA